VYPQGIRIERGPPSNVNVCHFSIIVYGSTRAFTSLKSQFSFTDSLYFGAMISATDPGQCHEQRGRRASVASRSSHCARHIQRLECRRRSLRNYLWRECSQRCRLLSLGQVGRTTGRSVRTRVHHLSIGSSSVPSRNTSPTRSRTSSIER
jgi:hypothetical protein